MTASPHECSQCALLVAAGEVPATCGDCGAVLSRSPARVPWRPHSGVAGMLRDLSDLRRYLCALPGVRSATGVALDAAASGVWGRGCSVAYAAPEPPAPLPPPSPALHRYRALAGQPGHRTRALLVDGLVAHASTQVVAGRTLTLEQAVGWHVAAPDAMRRIQIKLGTRDSRPALAALEAIGDAALRAAAREWGM